jgi:hypothetical protein
MRDLYPDARDRVVLRPSRKKWTLMLVLCAAFTVGGIWMILDGDAAGWFVAGFFGLCLLTSVLMLTRMVRLVLTPAGFTLRGPVRSVTYGWSDVTRFAPAATGATTRGRLRVPAGLRAA